MTPMSWFLLFCAAALIVVLIVTRKDR